MRERIEFQILNSWKYEDMRNVWVSLAEAKNTGRPQSNEYWLNRFPDYSLKQFYFSDTDMKPNFETKELGPDIWHFYSLVNLIQVDLDVELLECKRISDYGTIEYSAFGYPYGGITGLIMFLNSFDCKASRVVEAGIAHLVNWISETNFSLKEL